MKKKSILLVSVAVMLAAVLVVGGTLAYFTDTKNAKNVFTVGSVKIALHEANKITDVEAGEPVDRDAAYQTWLSAQKLIPTTAAHEANTISKVVTIENTGDNDAYVWVKVYIPAVLDDPDHRSLHVDGGNADWDYSMPSTTEEIDSVNYRVYTYLYHNKLGNDAETTPAIHQVYMDSAVTQSQGGGHVLADGTTVYTGSWDLIVEAYAIQADSFADVNAAYTAYDGE